MSCSVTQQPLRKHPPTAARGMRTKQSAARNPALAAKKKQIGLIQISKMGKTEDYKENHGPSDKREKELRPFIVLAFYI